MADNVNITLVSKGPKDTEKLGEEIGRNILGGEVIELRGDLGSGKTTFVRGLARGVGSKDHVASPSFTLSRVYKSENMTIHHMDFYRLEESGTMDLEIEELISDKSNVVVIEWADITRRALPDEHVVINITSSTEEQREISVTYPDKLKYVTKDLK